MDYKDIISLISKVLNPNELIQIQQYILNLQQRISELENINTQQTKEIIKLQSQIAEYNRWEEEKQKYEIKEISKGTFVYCLKETTQLFCPKCFNEDKVPIHLKPPIIRLSGRLECPKCKNMYRNDVS